jgi:hypothetical protein
MIPFFLKIIHPDNRVIHGADSAHLCQADPFLFTHLLQALQNLFSVIDPKHISIPKLPVLHNHVPSFPGKSGFIISEKPCIINVRLSRPITAGEEKNAVIQAISGAEREFDKHPYQSIISDKSKQHEFKSNRDKEQA